MPWEHIALLVGGGLAAGVVNTVAGGGSLLTVPLLHLVGLPGQLANGSNRVGVLVQCATAALRFHREGVPGLAGALPVLAPVCVGAALGAWSISALPDREFERLFGVLMLVLAIPALAGVRWPRAAGRAERRPWSTPLQVLVFGAIGVYGGAVQAGVGLPLIAALSASGMDLVRANSVKVVINLVLVLAALPIFAVRGLVRWDTALVLALGYGLGGLLGARLAVAGGAPWLRGAALLAVVALAAHMLGVY